MPSRLSGPDQGTDPSTDNGEPNKARLSSLHPINDTSFTSSKHDVRASPDAVDRRKLDKVAAWNQLTADDDSKQRTGRKATAAVPEPLPSPTAANAFKMTESSSWRLSRARGPWSCSLLTLIITAFAAITVFAITQAFLSRQLDPKGCDIPWTRPTYIEFKDFDTEHTRFATKYHLYMLRDGSYDEDTRVKGVPVLFIPGNAGSFKQGRILAFEALEQFHNGIQQDSQALKDGMTSLDLFAVDFNEDLSAFHGQTVLDQAEYLNDAVSYILSLYHDPRRSQREPGLPDPSSVILVGHSMGGVIARAMLTMPNYQSNSINTILTLSAPHARPPVSFDADLVHTYKRINDYWRQAYSQKWANDNPLWHVTLVSIAGGGLDTVIASDFASTESLVPSTHGFTVFTSGIPDVWTGADHLQMTWCVQLMKPIVKSLFKILDVHRPGQTRPRAERMRIFKKSLLTGMEDMVDKTMAQREASTLLTLEDDSNMLLATGQRLVIREFGQEKTPKAHLLPLPQQTSAGSKRFTFLSNLVLDEPGAGGALEVLFCSIYPLQPGQSAALFSMNMDLSGSATGTTRLACKNVASDTIHLPASTRESVYPFDKASPFSYLQYQLDDLLDYQYVAVIDKATEPFQGWAIAEFSNKKDYVMDYDIGLTSLLSFGLDVKLPAERPLSTEIRIPALSSSLLAFQLSLGKQACGQDAELFTPLLRQYITEPYESKYFVNVKAANISLHGIAPFMPPPLRTRAIHRGLSLQFWSDPTCNSSIDVSLKIDLLGSLGKLVMRYRLVFAAFPLLVVALVLRKQFQIYDESGIFIPFAESLDLCLRSSLPMLIIALSFLALSFSLSGVSSSERASLGLLGSTGNASETVVDFTKNDLLLGSQDPVFWFLVPLFGLLSIGACAVVNFLVLGLAHVCSVPYNWLTARPAWLRLENMGGRSMAPAGFSSGSSRRRIIMICVLLVLVSTIIPYQFAYLDAVFVQLYVCVRAVRLVHTSAAGTHQNFHNYAHSILLLMLWILPINIPVLLVWARNLAVHWLTPFTSHHNVFSIMPYLVLVETLTAGKMIPRLTSRSRYITNLILFSIAVYAAVYGVSYAYMLHHIVNGFCAWLVAVHFSASRFSLDGLIMEGDDQNQHQHQNHQTDPHPHRNHHRPGGGAGGGGGGGGGGGEEETHLKKRP